MQKSECVLVWARICVNACACMCDRSSQLVPAYSCSTPDIMLSHFCAITHFQPSPQTSGAVALISERPQKYPCRTKTVAHLVEYLPNIHEAQGFMPTTKDRCSGAHLYAQNRGGENRKIRSSRSSSPK